MLPHGGGRTRTRSAAQKKPRASRDAIDLEVVEAGLVTLNEIRPATYIGKGKVEEFAGPGGLDAGIVVMDCALAGAAA